MYNRQVWEATPADTPIHRADVRTKLLLLVAVMLFAIGLRDRAHCFCCLCCRWGCISWPVPPWNAGGC